MASNINPNNIDGTYPIAGQDNDSQGFRDNFTNIKTNLNYAAAEITDLQSKVILKQALTGTVLNNNMNGAVLSNAQLQNMSETRVLIGTAAGSVTLNYAAGPYQTIVLTDSVTLGFTNFTANGTLSRMRVQVVVDSDAVANSYTLTLPSAVTEGIESVQGLNNSVITFYRPGVYEYEFETDDNGVTVFVIDLSQNRDPIYLPSAEQLPNSTDAANSPFASSTKTTTYFSSNGATSYGRLAAGTPGQIKVLAMKQSVSGATTVITVTNAAWGGAGTITFSSTGQACTLMYIDSKWYCTGNNGAVFA